MLADERVRRSLVEGRSVLVGSVDAAGLPACCRAVALVVAPDAQSLTVYLPVATSADVIANLATNGRLAVVCSDPLTHGTLQLKGRRRAVRLARADEAGIVDAWVERFAGVLEQVGLPRRRTLSLTRWPAFAVELEVEAVFEQTPGPRAGELMKAR